ncbi:MAG: CtsR family transcriptional regulator [Oscillospiraceae bacterium]|nr:CtsR family transcriptional regulator [Oscillospiraceae bacterium]
MSLSNSIAEMIMDMLQSDGYTEIQRNVLAQTLGCVPSQINYVIASRFTPEQGYIVESRRGGGGFIRISRVNLSGGSTLMHVVNTVGGEMDEKTCRAHIVNLSHQSMIDESAARLMLAATSDKCFRTLPPDLRGAVRAAVFKQMLLTVI